MSLDYSVLNVTSYSLSLAELAYITGPPEVCAYGASQTPYASGEARNDRCVNGVHLLCSSARSTALWSLAYKTQVLK